MKVTLRRIVATATALFLCLGPGLAAPSAPADLAGRIFDSDFRSPATGLTVQALAEGEKTPTASASTDDAGRFRLADVPRGDYTLVFLDEAGTARAATRVEAGTRQGEHLMLALPEVAPGQTEEDDDGGILAWISSPTGATITMVAGAVVLAVLVDEAVGDDDDDLDLPPPDVSPSSPGDE
jgi:hypothetical protein